MTQDITKKLGDGEPSPPPATYKLLAEIETIAQRTTPPYAASALVKILELATDALKGRSGAAQEVSPREPLCPMCCKPAIMPVPPSELEVRELKAELQRLADQAHRFVQFPSAGEARITQSEISKAVELLTRWG